MEVNFEKLMVSLMITAVVVWIGIIPTITFISGGFAAGATHLAVNFGLYVAACAWYYKKHN